MATMDTGSGQIVETFEAENVKAGKLFGICIQVTTHRAGYFFSKVVYEGGDIHFVDRRTAKGIEFKPLSP